MPMTLDNNLLLKQCNMERNVSMLCIVLVVLTVADYLIPDPIPIVDEAILTLVSMGVCSRIRRKSLK